MSEASESAMDIENLFIEKPNVAEKNNAKTEIFEKFLDLRKKLRRSIFRDDEVRVRCLVYMWINRYLSLNSTLMMPK